MSIPRTAWSIVCDDVRQEIGNKHSLIGIYQYSLLVPQFPVTLARLCFIINARTGSNDPFKQLAFKVLKDEEEAIAEAKVDLSKIVFPSHLSVSEDEGFVTASVICSFSPLNIIEPCKLSARAYTESEELRAGSILIQRSDVLASQQSVGK